jgi:2-dehydro-3-deoxygalactonokinase
MVSPMRDLLLGVDWGTTNRRAYLIDRAGTCLARRADDRGLLAVRGGFDAALQALRQAMAVGDDVPVLMSGMIGSASGWQEVPYLGLDIPLGRLPLHVAAVTGQHRVGIVPGYRTQDGPVDVMRGEEVQLLGAAALGVGDGPVVLPGTHSKWAQLRAGAIEGFATFMTGELFAMLGREGTLAALLAPAPHDAAAFAAGLDEVRKGAPLTRSLFGVRARVVTGAMKAPAARSYVSGMLIGAEFTARLRHDPAPAGAPVHIVGSPALAGHYAAAARHFGLAPVALDPDAVYLAALRQFFDKV